jgi:hypothetical protein
LTHITFKGLIKHKGNPPADYVEVNYRYGDLKSIGGNLKISTEGNKILELANMVYYLHQKQEADEKRNVLHCMLTNYQFVNGTLYSTYKKLSDLFAEGNKTHPKCPQLNDFRTFLANLEVSIPKTSLLLLSL